MSENAKYSIEMNLDGMAAQGVPAGVGNRSLRFELELDASDADAANEVWYGHLGLFFGEEKAAAMKAQLVK